MDNSNFNSKTRTMKKAIQQRTRDAEGYRQRSACLCLKDGTDEILLISSRKNPHTFSVPGGGIESWEEPREAAIREVKEEAGAIGTLTSHLGVFQDDVRKNRTSVYVMKVAQLDDEWEESRLFGRIRKWFKLRDAMEHLSERRPEQGRYLENFYRQQREDVT